MGAGARWIVVIEDLGIAALQRDWLLSQARLSLFVEKEIKPADPLQFWEQLAGAPPDTDEYVRPQNLRRQIGPYGDDALLELHIQSHRVDWLLNSIPLPVNDGFPRVSTSLSEFAARVGKWAAQQAFSFNRLALAPTLGSPVEGRIEGYRKLVELVPSLGMLNPEDDISDVQFQINRPKNSTLIPELKYNRVMKWSVARLQQFRIEASGASAVGSEAYQCQLELDVNTPQRPEGLELALVPAIFGELCTFANEIMIGGELT